jgi:hypothetical protein
MTWIGIPTHGSVTMKTTASPRCPCVNDNTWSSWLNTESSTPDNLLGPAVVLSSCATWKAKWLELNLDLNMDHPSPCAILVKLRVAVTLTVASHTNLICVNIVKIYVHLQRNLLVIRVVKS